MPATHISCISRLRDSCRIVSPGNNLNIGDVSLELAEVDLLFKPVKRISTSGTSAMVITYNSSISAGVRSATSGRMNHPITTAIAPVAAKL
jgi:hypothetical protein